MMGPQLQQQLVPEHPVATENQNSHRTAPDLTAATTGAFLDGRRMLMEFLPWGESAPPQL